MHDARGLDYCTDERPPIGDDLAVSLAPWTDAVAQRRSMRAPVAAVVIDNALIGDECPGPCLARATTSHLTPGLCQA